MSKVLITGVAGLIGSRLADWLIENVEDITVIGIDNLSGGYIENVNKKVIFYKLDLVTETDKLNEIFVLHKPVYVYHFAAYAAEGLSPFIRTFNYDNNLRSTAAIVNECIKNDVKRLIFTSSMAVYGHSSSLILDETLQPNPIDPYGVAKYACEMDIRIAGEQHNLDWCIIRPHNCYSDDTEILTENGWKFFKDLIKDEKVLTLNSDNMTMEYHSPTNYQKFYVDDYLYNFNTKGIDMFVTSDHNMVTRTSKYNKIQKITANEIYNKPKKYYYYETLKSGYYLEQNKNDNFIIPELKDNLGRSMDNNHQNGCEKVVKPEDWFAFIGWYISEGSCFKTKSNYTVSISQCPDKNPENYKLIQNIIKNIGFNYYLNGKNININSKQLYYYIKDIFVISGSENKYIPREYFNYNVKNLKILFDNLMLGDGNKDYSRYSTNSKQLADDFQELCVKIGKCGTIHKENSNYGIIYRILLVKNTNPSFGDNYTKKINCDRLRYSGYVYDVTVPNHIIYVRRNGKACWGSNCYGVNQNIWDKYRNVLGIWMYQFKLNQPMTIYGDGTQTRAFSYIDDTLKPLWNAAIKKDASKEIINLGGIENYSINESNKILRDILKTDNVLYLEERYEAKNVIPSYQKSIDILDFEPTTNMYDGLVKMWEWAKDLPNKERYIWFKYELNNKIYSYWK